MSGLSASASAHACHTLSSRLEKFGAPTVWEEFTPLARTTGAINLGQGFPDWPSPRFVKDAIIRAVEDNQNQYCRSAGHPDLVKALARRYSPLMGLGRDVNWETEVTVGVGSSEVLFASMQAYLEPGDEVVLISPAFDIYAAQVTMAGGAAKYVPLRVKTRAASATSAGASGGSNSASASATAGEGDEEQYWSLDIEELRAAFTARTRILLINTPQNPTGQVLSLPELQGIAGILKDHPRVIALSDEVYENMLYDGVEHIRLATLPGMWDRCVTISSAGKTFSITGWKIGWAVGPAPLIKGIIITNQWVQFSVSTPAQAAVAACLDRAAEPYEGEESYYKWLQSDYHRKRNILLEALRSAGLKPIVPKGSFFIIADTSNIEIPAKYLEETTLASGPIMRRDWAFCCFLAMEIGVAAIPPSAFYEEKDKDLPRNLARFAFCKQDASLYDAAARLQKLRGYFKDPSLVKSLPPPPAPPASSS